MTQNHEKEKEKQIEKKGRFIIQEVIEEKKYSTRVRHGSIKGDTKMFVTFQSFEEELENLDKNYCYIFSHSNNSWINFIDFWNYENERKRIFKNEKEFDKKLFKYRESSIDEKNENIFLPKIINPLNERQLTINIGELETDNLYNNNIKTLLSPIPIKRTNILQMKTNFTTLQNNSPHQKLIRSNSSNFFELYNNLKRRGNTLIQPLNKEKSRSNSKIHVISNTLLRTSSHLSKFNLNINDYFGKTFTGVGRYNEKFLKIKECNKGEIIENKKKFFKILEINNCMSFSLNIK